jgi:hypothetical protein
MKQLEVIVYNPESIKPVITAVWWATVHDRVHLESNHHSVEEAADLLRNMGMPFGGAIKPTKDAKEEEVVVLKPSFRASLFVTSLEVLKNYLDHFLPPTITHMSITGPYGVDMEPLALLEMPYQKKFLLEAHSLQITKNGIIQAKENMSPWKVFSHKQYSTRDLIWVLFRTHKLCGAKYKYFYANADKWLPVAYGWKDKTFSVCFYGEADGLIHIKTKHVLLLTQLQKITDKSVFEALVNEIENP